MYAFCRVFNLTEDVCEEDLKSFVHSTMGINPITVFVARENFKCQGYAYLAFETQEDVLTAIRMLTGTEFMGQIIHLTL